MMYKLEDLNKDGFLTVKQLSKKYNKSKYVIQDWISKGWLKTKKVLIKDKNENGARMTWIIKEEDWLEIPTFVRNRKNTAWITRLKNMGKLKVQAKNL